MTRASPANLARASALLFAAALPSTAVASKAAPSDLVLAQAYLQADRNADGVLDASEQRRLEETLQLLGPSYGFQSAP